jgi:hypothetical protein
LERPCLAECDQLYKWSGHAEAGWLREMLYGCYALLGQWKPDFCSASLLDAGFGKRTIGFLKKPCFCALCALYVKADRATG